MSVVYLLAHLDDEYGCWPLIRRAREAGEDQHLLYVADYRDPAMARRRLAETRAFLAAEGVDPACALHIGRGTGAFDGRVHRALPAAWAAVAAALTDLAPRRLVVPAWEGGHMDHDMCALMAVRWGEPRGVPVEQFTLYNGLHRSGPLLRGGAPLAENGPVSRVSLSAGEWLSWMAGVRAFPSQAYAWSGIWPAMWSGFATRGFGVQRLDPARVEDRPHAGPLFYERMFRVPYAEVRAAADAALPRPGPAS